MNYYLIERINCFSSVALSLSLSLSHFLSNFRVNLPPARPPLHPCSLPPHLRPLPFHPIHLQMTISGVKMTEGPVGQSVIPHIFLMLGSVLFGGSNHRNKEKKFGTFIFIPLLLGFRSCWVRSSGVPLYINVSTQTFINCLSFRTVELQCRDIFHLGE